MPFDEVVKSAISRLGVVRVSNALNPLLYMAMVVIPLSWGCAWLFSDDLILKYGFAGLGAFIALAFLALYVWFAVTNPDRLQSEEYLVRKQELSIVERKGRSGPEVVPLPTNETPVQEQESVAHQRGGGAV